MHVHIISASEGTKIFEQLALDLDSERDVLEYRHSVKQSHGKGIFFCSSVDLNSDCYLIQRGFLYTSFDIILKGSLEVHVIPEKLFPPLLVH